MCDAWCGEMAAVGTDENLQALARELQSDMDARVVRRVFAESRGPSTVAEAYTQQRALRDVRLARGEEIAGFKIGYTSPSVRKGGFATMGTPPHPTPATPPWAAHKRRRRAQGSITACTATSGTRSSTPPAQRSTTAAWASKASLP